VIELEIDGLDSSGDGTATRGGRRVLVPFTIPGERIRARVVERRRQDWRARLVSIERASPHRVAARCPHFGLCGGCTWQHIAYPEQLRLKAALVERLLRDAVPAAPAVLGTLPGAPIDAPWGYRQKVHFVFGEAEPDSGRRAGPVMGHYARGTRRVVAVAQCPVHDERGNAVAFAVRDHLSGANCGSAGVRSVTVRVARHTPELMATIVARSDRDRALRSATQRFLRTAHGATSVHLNVHPRDDGFIFGEETRRLDGSARMRDEALGVSYLMSPTAFFQTNIDAAEQLVALVLDATSAAGDVVDLYAGAGLFAIPLARAGHRVVAVESNRSAVADGEASLALNNVARARCRFIARDVEGALAGLRAADGVVMDPPREGCSERVLAGVFGRLQPPTVVYVSCNPETLARDLRAADASGYTIDRVQPLDMFPHTAHVETVVALSRRGRPP
jgi:23S rRNA (uracil1939-C5)-methyltransferase